MSPQAEGEKNVATNRRARHDYQILERYEAGLVLTGDEVKSLRAGRASLTESFARIAGGEAWLEGMHVPAYEQGDKRRHLPLRPRKLLLHHREIDEITRATAEKGMTLVPVRLYYKNGRVKVAVSLAKGKKEYDKRETIKRREVDRETRAAIKGRRS